MFFTTKRSIAPMVTLIGSLLISGCGTKSDPLGYIPRPFGIGMDTAPWAANGPWQTIKPGKEYRGELAGWRYELDLTQSGEVVVMKSRQCPEGGTVSWTWRLHQTEAFGLSCAGRGLTVRAAEVEPSGFRETLPEPLKKALMKK